MKVSVEVDLKDLYDEYYDNVDKKIKEILWEEVQKHARKSISGMISGVADKILKDVSDPEIAALIKEAKKVQLLKAIEALK